MIGIGLLILRVVVGLTMAAHGAQKLFGWFGGPGIQGFAGFLSRLEIRPARFWAWVAGLAELCGGLALAIGLLTPLASCADADSTAELFGAARQSFALVFGRLDAYLSCIWGDDAAAA